MAGEPRASTRIERKPGPLLAGFSIAYVLFVAGFALYVAIRSHDDRLTEFFLDDWLNLFRREELPFFRWLFAYHNAHLIPATRLLLHLDYEYFSGRGVLPWLASFLSTGVTIAVLYRVLGMSRLDDLPSRRTLGAFFGFCLLWTGLFYGYLWGFSVHAPMTTMWLVVSVSCFVAIAVRPNGERAEIGRRLAVFGVAAALMATLSSAAGLCAWLALLVIAVAARLSRGITIAVVLGGAVSAALLAHAPVPAGSTADVVGRWLSEPATLLAFILSFIGIPVGWTAQGLFTLGDPAMRTVCLWAGGLGVVGLLAHSVRSLRATPVSDPLCLLGLALMGYCTAAATLAGLGGRTHFGAVNYRFTPVAVLFWMGAASALAARVPARAPSGRWLLVALLPAASIAMLSAPEERLETQRLIKAGTAAASLMLLVGIREESALLRLVRPAGLPASPEQTQRAEAMRAMLVMLERDGRGPFADPRRAHLGRPLAELYPASSTCAGRIDGWQEIGEEGARGAAIQGSIRETPDALAPISILVVDPIGVIRGLGNVLPERENRARWVAFVGAHAPELRYDVHAVLENGSVCLLARHRPGRRGAEQSE